MINNRSDGEFAENKRLTLPTTNFPICLKRKQTNATFVMNYFQLKRQTNDREPTVPQFVSPTNLVGIVPVGSFCLFTLPVNVRLRNRSSESDSPIQSLWFRLSTGRLNGVQLDELWWNSARWIQIARWTFCFKSSNKSLPYFKSDLLKR